MLKCLLVSLVTYCWFIMVDCFGDSGPGVWHVQYVNKCEEDNYKMRIELNQKKINRTHDGFNGHFVFEQDFTYGLGIRVEVKKLVDGGYRLQSVYSDPEIVEFINRYAEDNFKSFLLSAGVDPPEVPVEAGEYDVKDFLFNYEELPTESMYGQYSGTAYMLDQDEEIFCLEVYLEFVEEEDDDDDDDE